MHIPTRYPHKPGGLPSTLRNQSLPGSLFFACEEFALRRSAVPRDRWEMLQEIPSTIPWYTSERLERIFEESRTEAVRPLERAPEQDRLVQAHFRGSVGPRRPTRLLAFRPSNPDAALHTTYIKRSLWRFLRWALPGEKFLLTAQRNPVSPIAIRRGEVFTRELLKESPIALVAPFHPGENS